MPKRGILAIIKKLFIGISKNFLLFLTYFLKTKEILMVALFCVIYDLCICLLT